MITAKTLKAMRFAADLQDSEDNMSEDDAFNVTCDQYCISFEGGDELLESLPDDWESRFHNYLCGDFKETGEVSAECEN